MICYGAKPGNTHRYTEFSVESETAALNERLLQAFALPSWQHLSTPDVHGGEYERPALGSVLPQLERCIVGQGRQSLPCLRIAGWADTGHTLSANTGPTTTANGPLVEWRTPGGECQKAAVRSTTLQQQPSAHIRSFILSRTNDRSCQMQSLGQAISDNQENAFIVAVPSGNAKIRERRSGSRSDQFLRCKPRSYTTDRLLDPRSGNREADADEAAAVDGIEIQPGCECYARIAQQGFAEGEAVGRQVSDGNEPAGHGDRRQPFVGRSIRPAA